MACFRLLHDDDDDDDEFGQFVAIVCILLWIINNDKTILHIVIQV